MDELLHALEKRIKCLVEEHDKLAKANQALHRGKHLLNCEKESLLVKQEKAIQQIKVLISKLKEIEKSP